MIKNPIHHGRSLSHRVLLPLIAFIIIFSSCRRDQDAPPPVLPRTILVYMISDSKLDNFFNSNIQDMTAGMRGNNSGNLLIYYSPPNSSPTLRKINADGTESVIKTYSRESSPSAGRIRQVIEEIKESYPADSYGLILSSHGMGWYPAKGSYGARARAQREQIVLENPHLQITRHFGVGNKIDIPDLANALPANRFFEFILFDACFMANAETLYDLRYAANYIIGSQTEIMGSGFPYQRVTPLLFQDDKLKEVCYEFYQYYLNTNSTEKSGAISLIKTSELEKLADCVSPLLIGSTPTQMDAITGVQVCDRSTPALFYDLKHFLSLWDGASIDYFLFDQQLRKTVLYEAHTPTIYSIYGGTFNASNLNGISCYIPYSGRADNTAYYQTNWAKHLLGN